jgi:hypothetical protein
MLMIDSPERSILDSIFKIEHALRLLTNQEFLNPETYDA